MYLWRWKFEVTCKEVWLATPSSSAAATKANPSDDYQDTLELKFTATPLKGNNYEYESNWKNQARKQGRERKMG